MDCFLSLAFPVLTALMSPGHHSCQRDAPKGNHSNTFQKYHSQHTNISPLFVLKELHVFLYRHLQLLCNKGANCLLGTSELTFPSTQNVTPHFSSPNLLSSGLWCQLHKRSFLTILFQMSAPQTLCIPSPLIFVALIATRTICLLVGSVSSHWNVWSLSESYTVFC